MGAMGLGCTVPGKCLQQQQLNFGALTPCSGSLTPAVLLLPLGAPVISGRQDTTRPDCWLPSIQISLISEAFGGFSDEFVAPGGP